MPNEVQSEEVLLTIRLLIGILPAAFNVLAVLVLLRYPLSRQVHASIRNGIAAHNRGESFTDPITGRVIEPASRRLIDDEDGWFLDTFSSGELKRMLVAGPTRVKRDVWRAVLASGLAAVGCIMLAWETTGDLNREPGPSTILAVVGAGLAITALCFHLLRVRPASEIPSRGIDKQRITAHLTDL